MVPLDNAFRTSGDSTSNNWFRGKRKQRKRRTTRGKGRKIKHKDERRQDGQENQRNVES